MVEFQIFYAICCDAYGSIKYFCIPKSWHFSFHVGQFFIEIGVCIFDRTVCELMDLPFLNIYGQEDEKI